MSEQDSLRMVAEVVDRFSGPLKALRAQLQGMSKDGPAHAEAVAKGLNRIEASAKSAGQTASTVLNPALAAIGVTGLGVVAAMTGIGAALRSFGGNAAALGQLGRDAGIAAEQVRVIQNVLSKVGIDADASGGAIRQFAENMRLARDGIGPIMEFLRTQGRTAEGRAYFNGLADSLKNSRDNGEALTKALEAMEHIQDPAGRRKYAEEILRLGDAARIADGHLGSVRQQMERARRELGPLDPATVKAAEDFEKAMASLRTTMQKLGTAIATEAMPYVSEFVTGLKGLADNGRQDVTGPLREGVREIGKALREIDWSKASKDAGEFLKGAADGAKSLVSAVREVVAVLHALNEGRYMEALRRSDGASGPLARKLAPLPGDDKIEQGERAGKIRGDINTTREQAALLRDVLKESEETGDRGKAQQMRGALELNSRRMKDLEEALRKLTDGSATVQQQSFEGSGTGLGGLIRNASFGGSGGVGGSMRAVGRVLAQRENGIYAPGGGVAERGGIPRISPRPGGPGETVGRALRGDVEADSSPRFRSQGPVPKGMDERAQRVMARLIAKGWTPEAAATAVGQAVRESGVRSDGPSGDQGTAHGMFQWRNERFAALKAFAAERKKPWNDFDTQVDFFDHERKSRSGAERDWHNEKDFGRGNQIGKMYERYAGGLQAQRERHARQAYGKWKKGGTALPEPEGSSGTGADGEGFNARQKAMRDFNASTRGLPGLESDGGRSLLQRALKGPIGGGMRGDVTGNVQVNVARPGPDTQVNTSASGNLFRDVKLNRGSTMAQASQEN